MISYNFYPIILKSIGVSPVYIIIMFEYEPMYIILLQYYSGCACGVTGGWGLEKNQKAFNPYTPERAS